MVGDAALRARRVCGARLDRLALASVGNVVLKWEKKRVSAASGSVRLRADRLDGTRGAVAAEPPLRMRGGLALGRRIQRRNFSFLIVQRSDTPDTCVRQRRASLSVGPVHPNMT